MTKSLVSFKAFFSGLLLLISVYAQSQNYSLIQSVPQTDLENPFLAKDASGNVYIYGGNASSSTLVSQFYKFNPSTYQWTSFTSPLQPLAPAYGTQGLGSTANSPGARNLGASWIDASGNFWLYGGALSLVPSVMASDLWKYTVSTGEWTWISGSSSTNQAPVYGTMGVPSSTVYPGARQGIASWTDAAGNFWLFGGMSPTGLKNDLWKYNPTTNQWTWVNGSSANNPTGVYGTLGVSSSLNQPEGRWTSGVSDGLGNFYIFGGVGSGQKNDLWRYNIGTNQWTWISGGTGINQSGVYGTKGVASSGNYPGGRSAHTTFWDTGGNIWVFGGWGYNSTTYDNERNDLWKYSVTNNTWTWVKGDDAGMFSAASYGPLYFSLPSNEPSSNRFQAGWTDASNNLWIYAGSHYDLWRFNNCTPQAFVASASSPSICSGSSSTLSLSGATSYTWAGFTSANTSIVVTPTVTKTYTVGGNDASGCGNGTLITVSILPTPILIVSSSQASVCQGQSVVLSANGASSYTWNATQNTPAITVTPAVTSIYSVQGMSSNGCINSITFIQNVVPLPTITATSSHSLLCKGQYGTLTATGALSYTWNWNAHSTAQTTIVTTLIGATLFFITGSAANGCSTTTTFMQQVAQLPQVTIASTQILACSGQPITLNALGASTYTWNTNQSGSSISVSPVLNTGYTVTGTDANGCVNTATLMQLTVPLPIVTATTSNALPCSGQQVSLTASGASSYAWSNSQAGASIIVWPAASTNYTVTGTDANGCTNTAILFQNVAPFPLVIAYSSQTTICEGEAAILHTGGAQSYTWTPGNLMGFTISVSPVSDITYTVNGIDINGCSNSETITIAIAKCTGLTASNKNEEVFTISPNPNAGEFMIITNASVKGSTLVIMNALGQIVYSKLLEQEGESINPALSKGVYYYQITQQDASQASGKIVIE